MDSNLSFAERISNVLRQLLIEHIALGIFRNKQKVPLKYFPEINKIYREIRKRKMGTESFRDTFFQVKGSKITLNFDVMDEAFLYYYDLFRPITDPLIQPNDGNDRVAKLHAAFDEYFRYFCEILERIPNEKYSIDKTRRESYFSRKFPAQGKAGERLRGLRRVSPA